MNIQRIEKKSSTRWLAIAVASVLFLFFALLGHPPHKLVPYYSLSLTTASIGCFGTAWLAFQFVKPSRDGVFTVIGSGAILLLFAVNFALAIAYRGFLFAWQSDGVLLGVCILINALGVFLVLGFPFFASFAGGLTASDNSSCDRRRVFMNNLDEAHLLYQQYCAQENCDSTPSTTCPLARLRESARLISPSRETPACVAIDREIEASIAKLQAIVSGPKNFRSVANTSFDSIMWKCEIEKICSSINELFRRREATLVV
jgi:hypothetical protein